MKNKASERKSIPVFVDIDLGEATLDSIQEALEQSQYEYPESNIDTSFSPCFVFDYTEERYRILWHRFETDKELEKRLLKEEEYRRERKKKRLEEKKKQEAKDRKLYEKLKERFE